MNQFVFKRIILHNFLSYGHTELDLRDKGNCLVSGTNLCTRDRAESNGSGKSSIWSGINWTLTGRTISGIASDVKNLNIDQPDCWVYLDFNVNDKHYEITRYKAPKSNLKIVLNGVDISGKGIRQSQAVLNAHLPELDGDLLGSVILLGQSMPYKLSSRQPRQRKELLEKLSKTDFMVQQIKERVAKRQQELQQVAKQLQLEGTKLNILITSNQQEQSRIKAKLEQERLADHTIKIKEYQQQLAQLNSQRIKLSEAVTSQLVRLETARAQQAPIMAQTQQQRRKGYTQLENIKDTYRVRQTDLVTKIKLLRAEITSIQNIKTTCPTCGQAIPNVNKPSCEKQKQQVAKLEAQLQQVKSQADSVFTEAENKLSQLQATIRQRVSASMEAVQTLSKQKDDSTSQLMSVQRDISALNTKLTVEQRAREAQTQIILDCESRLAQLVFEHTQTTIKRQELSEKLQSTKQHLAVIKQMETLLRRDFRGLLLEHVINYINDGIKDYGKQLFDANQLSFSLDGNNINISYCGKLYEMLSGGEKQKVDILVQLAIRKMLSRYLDFSSNILVLDEIFDNLDPSGTRGVLQLIAQKLTDIQSIFIISHHAAELNINYDTQIRVIKNELGISQIH